MQTKELNLVIQGNYGQGWEDVSSYPCGVRQINFGKAYKEMKHDLAEYRLMGYPHRVIKRYEPIEE